MDAICCSWQRVLNRGQTAAARHRTHNRNANILKLVRELRQDLLVESVEKLEQHNQRQADGGRAERILFLCYRYVLDGEALELEVERQVDAWRGAGAD